MSECTEKSTLLVNEETSNRWDEGSQSEISEDETAEMIQQLTKCPTCPRNDGNCPTKRHIELSLLIGSKKYDDTFE